MTTSGVDLVVTLFQLLPSRQRLDCLKKLEAICDDFIVTPSVIRCGQKGWADPFAFPSDVMERILHYLTVEDVFTCRSVCHHWRQVVDDSNYIWAKIGTNLGIDFRDVDSEFIDCSDASDALVSSMLRQLECNDKKDDENSHAVICSEFEQQCERLRSKVESKLCEANEAIQEYACAMTLSPQDEDVAYEQMLVKRQKRRNELRMRSVNCLKVRSPIVTQASDLLFLCPNSGLMISLKSSGLGLYTYDIPIIPKCFVEEESIPLTKVMVFPQDVDTSIMSAWYVFKHYIFFCFKSVIIEVSIKSDNRDFELYRSFPFAGPPQILANDSHVVVMAGNNIASWPRSNRAIGYVPILRNHFSPDLEQSEQLRLLFLKSTYLYLAIESRKEVNIIYYELTTQNAHNIASVKVDVMITLATINGIVPWSFCAKGQEHHRISICIFGDAINTFSLKEYAVDTAGAPKLREISTGVQFTIKGHCCLVAAGLRLFVMWNHTRQELHYYSRQRPQQPTLTIRIKNYKFAKFRVPDFRFGQELNFGLPMLRNRPFVCVAKALRDGGLPSVTIHFA